MYHGILLPYLHSNPARLSACAIPQRFHQINDVTAGGALGLFGDDLVPLHIWSAPAPEGQQASHL
jgi:hypothetical protein